MKHSKSFKENVSYFFYGVMGFVASHVVLSAIVTAVIALAVALAIVLGIINSAPKVTDKLSSSEPDVSVIEQDVIPEEEPASSEEPASNEESVSNEEPVSNEETVSSETTVVNETPAITETPPAAPPAKIEYVYNSNMTPDNNIFLDALEFTGYNLTAQRNSGKMWASGKDYVLCGQKRGLGWLSNITYDDYGRATGYETNIHGQPDIAYFENKGLVCATYASYVYFNFLPNVAGIDTSMLPRPKESHSANDWYLAGQQWVNLGYSRYINFTASDGGSIYQDLKIYPDEQIPIGSLMIFCNWYNRTQWCSHICIYAGYMNGYHWVTHVGNENGPEFCAVERMNRNPHPQWPIAIITPPSVLNLASE